MAVHQGPVFISGCRDRSLRPAMALILLLGFFSTCVEDMLICAADADRVQLNSPCHTARL